MAVSQGRAARTWAYGLCRPTVVPQRAEHQVGYAHPITAQPARCTWAFDVTAIAVDDSPVATVTVNDRIHHIDLGGGSQGDINAVSCAVCVVADRHAVQLERSADDDQAGAGYGGVPDDRRVDDFPETRRIRDVDSAIDPPTAEFPLIVDAVMLRSQSVDHTPPILEA